MKIAVLGAGVAGITVARRLKDQGADCAVFEKNDTIGGLARTRITQGYTYDLCGGHIFWQYKVPEIAEWVFKALPKENWQFKRPNPKIFFDGRKISHPFELSLYELPVAQAVSLMHDFLFARRGEKPGNFHDWITWFFGRGIAEYYMHPYNEKIWAYPLAQMEAGWMDDNIPQPDVNNILTSALTKQQPTEGLLYSEMCYPLRGGIQSMFNALAAGLEVRTDAPVQRIEQEKGKYRVNGELFDAVISTIYPHDLIKAMTLPNAVIDAVKGFKYNSLTTVCVACPPTDISWLYIPSKKYKAHRIGYQSCLSPYAAPEGCGAGAFEVIGPPFDVSDKVIQNNEYIPEELEVSAVIDTEFSEHAYVIYDLDYRKNVAIADGYFSTLPNFYTLGKWGHWNYDNMDKCMRKAFALAGRIMQQ
jgi:protoporphyrinogen oxidase